MAQDELTIAVDGIAALRITSHSGKVVVVAEDRPDVSASGSRITAEINGEGVIVISGSGSGLIHVRCPAGMAVVIGTTSGSIETRGDLGDVRATSVSGRLSIESARRADLRSEAGGVTIRQCEGGCRVQTTSGTVEVNRAMGAAEISTASGAVTVVHADGRARVRTASGAVVVGGSGKDDIAVQTMSGRVTVTLPSETRPDARLHSMSGEECCSLPSGTDCLVAVHSMQGAIDVVGVT